MKSGYVGSKFGPFGWPLKEVIPNHVASPSLQNAEAFVFMHIARCKDRLFTHYALSLHLRVTAQVIVDVPVPPQQLCGTVAYVLNADVVYKKISRLARVGVFRREARRYRDANAVGTTIVERLHAYLTRVTETMLCALRGIWMVSRVLAEFAVASMM
jgi:hypothetical protein